MNARSILRNSGLVRIFPQSPALVTGRLQVRVEPDRTPASGFGGRAEVAFWDVPYWIYEYIFYATMRARGRDNIVFTSAAGRGWLNR